MSYQPTAYEIEAAWAVMHDGAEMNGGAYRLTERALIAAADARSAHPPTVAPALPEGAHEHPRGVLS